MKSFVFRLSLVVLVTAVAVTPAALACKVDESGFSTAYRDLNSNLNDYGRIHADADNPSCAQAAKNKLILKIQNSLNANSNAYNEWLTGAHVALIFAAALRIGANGYLTAALDTELRRVEAGYPTYSTYIDPGCDSTGNQCLDDYAVAASGHAWIAAYKYRRMDSYASVNYRRSIALDFVNTFFSAVCIHTDESSPVFCNGTVLDLGGDWNGRVQSMNHGQQMPSYGFGLMTSIASALLGVEASGWTTSFTTDQQTLALNLASEMQDAVNTAPAPDQFLSNCVKWAWNGNEYYVYDSDVFCGGPDNYQPEMYALQTFYNAKVGGMPYGLPGLYMSSYFNAGHFQLGSNDNTFYSFGRYETYGKHGYSWWVSTPTWMPRDGSPLP